MNHIVLNDGFVVSSGRMQKEFWPAGAIAVEQLPRSHDGPIRYEGGKYVYLDAPAPPIEQQRARSYPPIGDQLDAIWHAMDQGLLPKIEPMYSSVLAVKQKLPKST